VHGVFFFFFGAGHVQGYGSVVQFTAPLDDDSLTKGGSQRLIYSLGEQYHTLRQFNFDCHPEVVYNRK